MDHTPTLDQSASLNRPEVVHPLPRVAEPFTSLEGLPDFLRFPGDDGGRSLIEMADRDLEATLQLLAERARYITGASGAAIALREGEGMVCCASAGTSAPKLGTHLEVSSGLSGESVRTRQILGCDDAESDPRVNRESCRALGIVSAMVMPLQRQEQVIGVFELLSGQRRAFRERDLVVLQRLGEMIETAVDHAEAANRIQREIIPEENANLSGHTKFEILALPEFRSTALPEGEVDPEPVAVTNLAAAPSVERGNIGKCATCGFPVSKGRSLCLDCEPSLAPNRDSGDNPAPSEAASDAVDVDAEQESWMPPNKYLIGTLLVAVATMALVLWLR